MKVYSKEKYKSITPLSEMELPEFVVLTGLNGAGKTQFLEGINAGVIMVEEAGSSLSPKKYVKSHELAPKHKAGINQDELSKRKRYEYENLKTEFQKIKEGYVGSELQDELYKHFMNRLSTISGKSLNELDESDFDQYFSEIAENFSGLSDLSLFDHDLSKLFKTYQIRKLENLFFEFLHERLGRSDVKFIPQQQFDELFTPPWVLLNQILEESGLDYTAKEPNEWEEAEAIFEFKLKCLTNDNEVALYDLSSGEKVIMSLVFVLYNASFDFLFPAVLLLDEPDASLHPSMTKQFLNVVQNVLVEKHHVKVIMTTHSPSTVALAPENSIYVASRTGERVRKTTKDEALKVLTTGVPSFSVNYENRRQVFVESPFDVIYFEKLYNLLSAHLEAEISLTFIASGESRTDKNGMKVSNCEQVQNITNMLREGGNNFVFGVIDYDGLNTSDGGVFVLGEGQRDNIESYLLDPIVLACLLIREGIIKSEELGLSPTLRYVEFENLSAEEIQVVSDSVTELILPIKGEAADIKSIECELMGGEKYNLVEEYAKLDGHDLEEAVLKAFPKLHDIKRGDEEKLKLHILERVLNDVPDILSIDILNVFKRIQKA